jgi:hypothetical protein
MKFTINMYIQILTTICSQYKIISKSVLTLKTFVFLVKETTKILLKLGFIEFSEKHVHNQYGTVKALAR